MAVGSLPTPQSFKVFNPTASIHFDTYVGWRRPETELTGRSLTGLQFSLDGVNWAPEVSLGDLDVDELSPEIFYRPFPVSGSPGAKAGWITTSSGPMWS